MKVSCPGKTKKKRFDKLKTLHGYALNLSELPDYCKPRDIDADEEENFEEEEFEDPEDVESPFEFLIELSGEFW